uniref:Uncharacterized protein n=1 Tax=Anguilla anguilla TaxID=7936 RepID=A0A0E9SP06_ANGAN
MLCKSCVSLWIRASGKCL